MKKKTYLMTGSFACLLLTGCAGGTGGATTGYTASTYSAIPIRTHYISFYTAPLYRPYYRPYAQPYTYPYYYQSRNDYSSLITYSSRSRFYQPIYYRSGAINYGRGFRRY